MLKPDQINKKAIDDYYDNLGTYRDQGVSNESSTRMAFATLLETLAKNVGWMLIQEYRFADIETMCLARECGEMI